MGQRLIHCVYSSAWLQEELWPLQAQEKVGWSHGGGGYCWSKVRENTLCVCFVWHKSLLTATVKEEPHRCRQRSGYLHVDWRSSVLSSADKFLDSPHGKDRDFGLSCRSEQRHANDARIWPLHQRFIFILRNRGEKHSKQSKCLWWGQSVF